MKRTTLAILSAVFLPLTALPVDAQDDEVVFGAVTTTRATILRVTPSDSAVGQVNLLPETDLRWTMGDKENNYLRVMIPKGQSGWVLEADVRKVREADLLIIEALRTARPCVEPPTLDACITMKPTGCALPNTPDGLANRLKRTVPQPGAAKTLTFKIFTELQDEAVRLVDQGVSISPADRDKIKNIATSAGIVGEGSRVRLKAFLPDGKPHANSIESVNCRLTQEPNMDIHISLTESKNQSEFGGIVVEMIPQNRPSKWTVHNVSGLRGKLLLIEGALFYDNHHVTNTDAAHPVSGQSPRFSLWELHPVASLKVCKNADAQCDPDQSADWEDF